MSDEPPLLSSLIFVILNSDTWCCYCWERELGSTCMKDEMSDWGWLLALPGIQAPRILSWGFTSQSITCRRCGGKRLVWHKLALHSSKLSPWKGHDTQVTTTTMPQQFAQSTFTYSPILLTSHYIRQERVYRRLRLYLTLALASQLESKCFRALEFTDKYHIPVVCIASKIPLVTSLLAEHVDLKGAP